MHLSEAISSPTEDDEWIKTILIGGVLVLLGFLIVPLIIAYGYMLRVLRARLADAPEPPRFTEWGNLLVTGVKAWVIGLVYMLIPLIVGAVVIGGSILAIATGTEAGAGAGLAGSLFGMVLTAVLLLLFSYAATAGLVNFAKEDRLGAAFDVDVLTDVLTDTAFLVPWLVGLVALFVAGAVGGIPLIGWLISPFVTFYAFVVAAHLWAEGFADALGHESTPVQPDADDPAR